MSVQQFEIDIDGVRVHIPSLYLNEPLPLPHQISVNGIAYLRAPLPSPYTDGKIGMAIHASTPQFDEEARVASLVRAEQWRREEAWEQRQGGPLVYPLMPPNGLYWLVRPHQADEVVRVVGDEIWFLSEQATAMRFVDKESLADAEFWPLTPAPTETIKAVGPETA